MEKNEEYHDPDYPEASVQVKVEVDSLTEEEKEEKTRSIIQREFKNEIDVREDEVMLADQRMATARRMLHRLRCVLVSRYYRDKKLQLPEEPEVGRGSRGSLRDFVLSQQVPTSTSSSSLRSGQRRLHPSVRKLLGKTTADMEDIFRPLATRNKRRDYSAMLQARNYTIQADGSSSLRPEEPEPAEPDPKPTKMPRHIEPRPENVLTLYEVTRNKMKHRYRIIIGNTSKYAPAASTMDRSTHKWLLYVRGPTGHDASKLLRAVVVTLHHSYAPHHIVHIDKPPYHISRRGWGEFPARVELHFKLPERNRPATVEHTIKLDRHYTGLQTLGAETLVDVWLYSTPDMLECEYKEEQDALPEPAPVPKQEPAEPEPEPPAPDSWLDFFTENTKLDVDEMIIKPEKKQDNHIENHLDLDNHIEQHLDLEPKDIKPNIFDLENTIKMENDQVDWSLDKTVENPAETIPNEILNQPASPKKRIMKYLDPKTGKIYYLEMDRNLDLSKVQEIVINSKGNMKTAKLSPVKQNGVKKVKKGVSLLKPEVKNLINNKEKLKKSFTHIQNDHCYLGVTWAKSITFSAPDKVLVKRESNLYDSLCACVSRFTCVRVAVNYLLRKVPIVTELARDPEFRKCFPFAVDSDERFWKMDFAKRRNKEWSRAKLINTILLEHLRTTEPIWRTKQILIFSRLHGYQPVRRDSFPTDYWDSTEITTDPATISAFNPEDFNNSLTDTVDVSDDEDVEVYSFTDYWDSTEITTDPATISVFNPEDFNKSLTDTVDVSDDEDVEVYSFTDYWDSTEITTDPATISVFNPEDFNNSLTDTVDVSDDEDVEVYSFTDYWDSTEITTDPATISVFNPEDFNNSLTDTVDVSDDEDVEVYSFTDYWDSTEITTDPATISVFNPEDFNKSLTDTVDVSDDEDVEVYSFTDYWDSTEITTDPATISVFNPEDSNKSLTDTVDVSDDEDVELHRLLGSTEITTDPATISVFNLEDFNNSLTDTVDVSDDEDVEVYSFTDYWDSTEITTDPATISAFNPEDFNKSLTDTVDVSDDEDVEVCITLHLSKSLLNSFTDYWDSTEITTDPATISAFNPEDFNKSLTDTVDVSDDEDVEVYSFTDYWDSTEITTDPATISAFNPEDFNKSLTDTVDVSDDEDVEVYSFTDYWDSTEITTDPATISVFNPEDFNNSLTDTVDVSDDEDVEVVGEVPSRVGVGKEEPSGLSVMPVAREEDRLRFLFLERTCADIGVELRNEDVGNGYSYSAVHAVLLSALRNFAEELTRSSLAAAVLQASAPPPDQGPAVWTGWATGTAVPPRCVALGAARARLAAVTNRDCGASRKHADEQL
ncbi:uncharacterized protein LOC134659087 [Cydia amplana]|uniref:uncharacterized protein LOC134659087 n=1 Tax=Cydia amplana TaxID=1869771 RepID=UPI002FE5FE95